MNTARGPSCPFAGRPRTPLSSTNASFKSFNRDSSFLQGNFKTPGGSPGNVGRMGNPHSAATLDMTQPLTLDNADVTGMVRALQTGERAHADRLLPILYDELRRLARTHLRRER